jgi:hypothetical protein
MGIDRHVTPDDRAASPYLEVPFEVPPGAGSVDVRLRYDRAAGVVDLGCMGPAGFRGWSGGLASGSQSRRTTRRLATCPASSRMGSGR